MSLTIEDGSIVAGADSYATVAELRQYAAARGLSAPPATSDGDTTCEQLLRKACDYLQAQEPRYKGQRLTLAQPLAFPRMNVMINGYYWPSNTIHPDLKAAQMQLALDAQSVTLQKTVDVDQQRGPVSEETVGPITTRYAEPGVKRTQSVFAAAEGLLTKFCNSGPSQLKLVRG